MQLQQRKQLFAKIEMAKIIITKSMDTENSTKRVSCIWVHFGLLIDLSFEWKENSFLERRSNSASNNSRN